MKNSEVFKQVVKKTANKMKIERGEKMRPVLPDNIPPRKRGTPYAFCMAGGFINVEKIPRLAALGTPFFKGGEQLLCCWR
jgi:hypothetical protein